MNELWKDIEGYESYYQVSNLGNVRSLDRVVTRSDSRTAKLKGKNKGLYKGKVGYYVVTLLKDGEQSLTYVHRLVALHFIESVDNRNVVNHKDGNKLNNNVSNLEWVTQSENNYHAIETGLSIAFKNGEDNIASKLTESDVLNIRALYSEKRFKQYEIAEKYNVCKQLISLIVNRKRWGYLE